MQINRPKQKNYYKKIRPTMFEMGWSGRIIELKAFKERFGHCNVPQFWDEDIALGRWVIRQRVYKSRLSADRIEDLDKLGFVWNINEAAWLQSYQELLVFKAEHGHCNPSKGNKEELKLADWVNKQRQDRKNNKVRLTQTKIDKLDQIGFEWQQHAKPGWEKLYVDLHKFYEKYGHCSVPRLWKENKTLANWVSIQRRDKAKLSEQQKEKLNVLGFVWSIKPRKNKVYTYIGV